MVVTKHAFQRQVTFPTLNLFFASICLLLFTYLPVVAQPSPDRGRASIMVGADVFNSPDADKIIIRIVDNTDERLLANIAEKLGQRFHAKPTNLSYETYDTNEFITDKGIGLNFYLPVLPREQGHALPLAPFIEVFAPYVSHLQMLCLIKGNYACTGYESYRNPEVKLKLEDPVPSNNALQTAFYGVRADIASPILHPQLWQMPLGRGSKNNRILVLFGYIVLAGIIGATIGLFLSLIFRRGKPKAQ